MRVEILQKKLTEEERKLSNSISEVGLVKRFSVETDLLADVDDSKIPSLDAREKEMLFESEIQTLKSRISELESLKSQKST